MKVNHSIEIKKEAPEYAKVLRAIRLSEGFTQREVAIALGISHMGISHFETGTRSPNLAQLESWANVLGAEVVIGIKLID